MKYQRKRIVCCCLLLALLVALTGCGPAKQTAAGTGAKAEIKLTDMMERSVTLPKAAERIVALSAGDCEILYAIGAGSALVGRGEYCDYPAEITDLPSLSSATELNVEQVLALEPDAVVLSRIDLLSDQLETLEKSGVPVVVTDADDIEGVYEAISLLGQATGHTGEAEQTAAEMKKAFQALAERAKGKAGGSVYFEVSPLEYGLWTAGTDTFLNEIAQLVGLTNSFADVSGWAQVSEEQVLARDPENIVTIAMYFGEGQTPEEEILSRKGWSNVRAVREDRVYNIDSNASARPGPRLVEAAEELYACVYGENPA